MVDNVWLVSPCATINEYVLTGNTVTECMNTDKTQKETAKLFNQLADHNPDVCWMFSPDWTELKYVNSAYEEMWDRSIRSLADDPSDFLNGIHPDDRKRVEEKMEQLSNEEVINVEYRVNTKEDDERHVWVDGRPIYDDEDEFVAIAGYCRDITERKQYKEQLEQKSEQLEALTRLVRHDIRNDMTVILGRAEFLDEYISPEGEENLQKLKDSSEHIVELTEIAGEFVETLGEQNTAEIEPNSIRSILTTQLDTARDFYPEAEFVIVGEIPDVDVQANELFGSVFRNLFNNAVQHNDKDTPVVEVDCNARTDKIEIRIADNGPGIRDEQKQSIFGKGKKGLDSPGTGIGLYLVDTLVEMYDGDVWVEDNEPDGTVFIVKLPIAG